MLFHIFSNQEERRKFGGTDFFEIQFCRMLRAAGIKTITAVDSIRHWRNDSLYVSGDDDVFWREYHKIFDCGIYNNLKSGPVDLCGINYYGPRHIAPILAKLLEAKPADHERLIEWLNTAKQYNGFYILGV